MAGLLIVQCLDCGVNPNDPTATIDKPCPRCGGQLDYRVCYAGPVDLRCIDCDGDCGTAVCGTFMRPDHYKPCPKCGGNRIQYAPVDDDRNPIFGDQRKLPGIIRDVPGE